MCVVIYFWYNYLFTSKLKQNVDVNHATPFGGDITDYCIDNIYSAGCS